MSVNHNAYLQVERLSHSFGPTEVLRDINFRLEHQQTVSVVGPSGGGKTTLLHLCADLLTVAEGRVENTFGRSAFAFQDARLLPWQTAWDNIAFGLKAMGVAKSERREKARHIGLQFGLGPEDLDKFPKDLSGGMRQRVAFARALVVEPQLLFLDEPFSALDIGLKQELQSILVDQVEQGLLSILFITHDLMEAVRLSHQIILMGSEPGKIVELFHLDTPLIQRDDAFVYQETMRLLANTKVRETFGLTIGGVKND